MYVQYLNVNIYLYFFALQKAKNKQIRSDIRCDVFVITLNRINVWLGAYNDGGTWRWESNNQKIMYKINKFQTEDTYRNGTSLNFEHGSSNAYTICERIGSGTLLGITLHIGL